MVSSNSASEPNHLACIPGLENQNCKILLIVAESSEERGFAADDEDIDLICRNEGPVWVVLKLRTFERYENGVVNRLEVFESLTVTLSSFPSNPRSTRYFRDDGTLFGNVTSALRAT